MENKIQMTEVNTHTHTLLESTSKQRHEDHSEKLF